MPFESEDFKSCQLPDKDRRQDAEVCHPPFKLRPLRVTGSAAFRRSAFGGEFTSHARKVNRPDPKRARCSGQAMLESLLAICLISMILAGGLQISQMYATREIMNHAAARGARAKTVGFNRWMVRKAIYVASIPSAGQMITPDDIEDADNEALNNMIATAQNRRRESDPTIYSIWNAALNGNLRSPSAQYATERARIPEFMGTVNFEQSVHILNYEAWEDDLLHVSVSGESFTSDDGATIANPMVDVSVWMNYTNWLSLPRTFYSGDSIRINGDHSIENHYPLYLDDQGW